MDCLDRIDLCGGIEEVAHIISVLLPETNPERLLANVADMTNQALVHRLGCILEKLSTQFPVPETLLDRREERPLAAPNSAKTTLVNIYRLEELTATKLRLSGGTTFVSLRAHRPVGDDSIEGRNRSSDC